MVASWDSLGDISPDHYDPSGIDPYEMRDLRDPRQAAGPVEPRGQSAGPVSLNGLPPAQNQAPVPRGIALAPDRNHWDDPLGGSTGMDGYLYGRDGIGQLPEDVPDQPGRGEPGYAEFQQAQFAKSFSATAPEKPGTSAASIFTQIPWAEIGKTAQQATDLYTQQQQLALLNRARSQKGLQPLSQLPVVQKPAIPGATYGMTTTAKVLLAAGAVAAVGLGIWLIKRRRS
jgi:hypothetical protein